MRADTNEIPADSQERHYFETLLADLSSQFILLPSEQIDSAILDAQRRVCECLGLEVASLWQWTPSDPDRWTRTHAFWTRDEEVPAPVVGSEDFPWTQRLAMSGRRLVLESMRDLPAEATRDRESWEALGTKAALVLPLSVGERVPLGVLAFDSPTERSWPDALISRLSVIGQVFANALARRDADLAVRESESRLRLAAEAAGAGLFSLDLKTGRYWRLSQARAMFGLPERDDITFDDVIALVHSDDREQVRRTIREVIATKSEGAVDFRITGPDGSTRWMQSRGRIEFNAMGEPERLLGVTVDITSARMAEQQMRESQARYATGADLAGLGFYEVERDSSVLYVDERAMDLFGIPPDLELGGVREFWMRRIHPEDLPMVTQAQEQVNGGRSDRVGAEDRYQHPTKGERWVRHLVTATERRADGVLWRSLGVVRDVTDRRRNVEDLRRSLAEIAELKDRLQAESQYLKAEIQVGQQHDITGQSAAIMRVLSLVEQVAPTNAPVLVQGETGTGKELVGRAIHRLSPRSQGVMVKVNCAALPSGLVESELFGREKGAYTGALTRQVGRFELADGSTLFLDEVGELSLEVQAKLLRVLESGEFERLGSSRTVKVDVRLVAATNRNLLDEVKHGRFREDLYYRLGVFPLHVPPLRERVEDIPLLVWALLEECLTRIGKKITRVSKPTMESLQRRPWPGNIRELRNLIEYAAIVTRGDTLMVPSYTEAAEVEPAATLEEVERRHILTVLEATHWQVKGPRGAAVALGLKPGTLYGRLRKLGLWPREDVPDGRE